MADNNEKLNSLLSKLELLLEKQESLSKEINDFRIEVSNYKSGQEQSLPIDPQNIISPPPDVKKVPVTNSTLRL